MTVCSYTSSRSNNLRLCLIVVTAIIPLLSGSSLCVAQTNGIDSLHFMFWNVENLFDTSHDSLKNDHDFLPGSPRRWTFYKYRQKLINVTKTIVASGDNGWPAFIGMCEIENDSVIRDLNRLTPFREMNYSHCITKSPDIRGINVAFFYRRNMLKLISKTEYVVKMPDGFKPTRNILHVTGMIKSGDTLDIFICHFPSRSGGEARTRNARICASDRLHSVLDSLNDIRSTPNYIIMGDMNDYPKDLTLCIPGRYNTPLVDYMGLISGYERGSHKFDGRWDYLDHILSGQNIADSTNNLWIGNVSEFRAGFLLTDDTRYYGKRCLRTYYGYKYEGGYSDHLPVTGWLYFRKK